MSTLLLVAGTTETASIEGLSAAGARPDLLAHTPAADAEIVAFGRPIRAPMVPVSPDGCPTPALVTRAVRDLHGFELLVIDAGLAVPTAAPTVSMAASPGGDIRQGVPVPEAVGLYERARAFGNALPDGRVVIAETIPGGTTTAMGVLRALGEEFATSSSLPVNPVARKRAVVAAGLEASDLATGDLAGRPLEAVRRMGDPTLAVTTGLLAGTLDRDAPVTLGGGTQMLAVAALARHAGVADGFALATTPFVAEDEGVDLAGATGDLDVDLHVTDPGFPPDEHVAMDRYRAGVGKEGAGMGGALHMAARAGIPMGEVRDRFLTRYEGLVGADGP